MKRTDGRRIQTLDPFTQLIPYIMTERNDAQNTYRQRLEITRIRGYLQEVRQRNGEVSFLCFLVALYVRVLALRPRLNRFVINGRIYARHGIQICLVVKKELHDDAPETVLKFSFTGHENLEEVSRTVTRAIEENNRDGKNGVDSLVDRIARLPGPLARLAVGSIKTLDRWNLLPPDIVEASPFHASLFLTYLKSINLDYVYHHLYDFGTTGIFVAIGKDRMVPVADRGAVEPRRCCDIGYTIDERLCDGLYFSNSLRLVRRLLDDPSLLEARLTELPPDLP